MIGSLNLIDVTYIIELWLVAGGLSFWAVLDYRIWWFATIGTLEDFSVNACCVIFLQVTYRFDFHEAVASMFTRVIDSWSTFVHVGGHNSSGVLNLLIAIKVIVENVLLGPLRYRCRLFKFILSLQHG